MFSSFSGCFGNTDSRTRNSNSLTVPCRDNFAQHSQDHTSTTSHQENNLTQYLIVTLRDPPPPPGVTIFEGSLPLSKHDLRTPFPQIFGLPFGISQVCYLDDHTLPRRKKTLSLSSLSGHFTPFFWNSLKTVLLVTLPLF